jgi:omega-amidase
MLEEAVSNGAKLLVLGEMFANPYSHESFRRYAEEIPNLGTIPESHHGSITHFISVSAQQLNTWIVGGSIPERDGSKIFNTCIVCDAVGRIVGKYRKLHLFDVDVPDDPSKNQTGVRFMESSTLTAGDLGPCVVSTPWGFDLGVGICYDLRFPEYAITLRNVSSNRAKLMIYPGAFNTITGPLHWELLGRARAVDTQSFVMLASPARSLNQNDYQVW